MITIPTWLFGILVMISCGLVGGLIGQALAKLLFKIMYRKENKK